MLAADTTAGTLKALGESRDHITIIPTLPELHIVILNKLLGLKVRDLERKAYDDDTFQEVTGKIDTLTETA